MCSTPYTSWDSIGSRVNWNPFGGEDYVVQTNVSNTRVDRVRGMPCPDNSPYILLGARVFGQKHAKQYFAVAYGLACRSVWCS